LASVIAALLSVAPGASPLDVADTPSRRIRDDIAVEGRRTVLHSRQATVDDIVQAARVCGFVIVIATPRTQSSCRSSSSGGGSTPSATTRT
jgi:hypothetical protein